jgi:hypothetical protein
MYHTMAERRMERSQTKALDRNKITSCAECEMPYMNNTNGGPNAVNAFAMKDIQVINLQQVF